MMGVLCVLGVSLIYFVTLFLFLRLNEKVKENNSKNNLIQI